MPHLRLSHVALSWEDIFEGLHAVGGFLAMHLAQARSAVWRETGIGEMPRDSWAQVITYCVNLGKKLHCSESHFPHVQD